MTMTLNQQIKKKLRDPWWRINNLYYIKDKEGKERLFKCNKAQEELFNSPHNNQIVLKSRQLGVTTFFALRWLDAAFWSVDGVNCGIIAHRREDSELIFFDKVKFAFDKMPDWTRMFNNASNDSARELRFENGSTFRVSTSMRGRTLQYLHISEFGKICKINPSLADEIVTGSLNAVDANQHIAIESTAEGRDGYFYKFCKKAEEQKLNSEELTSLDYDFFFFPWYQDISYQLQAPYNPTPEKEAYFNSLKAKLTDSQKAWYEKKAYLLGDKMMQEYPSTSEESFMQSTEGFWYADLIKDLYDRGNICTIPYDVTYPVHTAWDLGIKDSTAIWFFQIVKGKIHFINYYEANGKALHFYVSQLDEIKLKSGYIYGKHYLPHDVKAKELGTGQSRQEILTRLGIQVSIVPKLTLQDGIQAVRSTLPISFFDMKNCEQGIAYLQTYKKEWSNKLSGYVDKPVHDEASHCADAFRYACLSYQKASRYKDDEESWQEVDSAWRRNMISV